MPKAADPELGIVEVVAGFTCPLGSFYPGERLRSDDPVVKKYPANFRPLTLRSTRTAPPVEQATAAPGEKRGA